ncbi:ABC transporter permease [Marinoscillum sp. 108]|uniref:ABC transporter permease n=1 Tax=Marinoscillum sp. 108 TaxID=2653151 RepID=UPI0012F39D71|nr:ABC transporter permease [Marinoscillum sp. 108]VXD16314.1 Transport permease protein [Marinoscillum sp. 108]
MKRFAAFVTKEFYHILRDKRTLVILIGMPTVMIMLFGFAITNELKEARVAFLDHSNDPQTLAIQEKILASPYFSLSGQISSPTGIEDIFRDGQTKLVMVFESDFGQRLEKDGQANIQLIADATDPNTASTVVNYAQAIILDYTRNIIPQQSTPLINVQSQMRYNPELNGVYYFVPGLIAILLMLVSAMMTSISIAREKETGTMEVLLASPMKPAQIILAKVVPYVLLSFLDAVLILTLGKFVFGVPILGSLGLLLGVTLLFILLALSLGILISTVSPNQQTALLLSLMGLMLPTILLSGFIFPIENMPLLLQVISNIIPARWFIIAVKSIMLKGSGFLLLWKEILIMFGFILFFIAVSVRKFKIRLE